MNWQQKAAALFALGGNPSIRMRKVGDWYVNQDVEIKDESILKGSYGNGATPEAAIEDHWHVLVEELRPHEYLVVHSHGERKAFRWNGFMWDHIVEKTAA